MSNGLTEDQRRHLEELAFHIDQAFMNPSQEVFYYNRGRFRILRDEKFGTSVCIPFDDTNLTFCLQTKKTNHAGFRSVDLLIDNDSARIITVIWNGDYTDMGVIDGAFTDDLPGCCTEIIVTKTT